MVWKDTRRRPERRLDDAFRNRARERDKARYERIKDTPEYKERIRLQSIKKRREHPERDAARWAVHRAVKMGEMVRENCVKCGNSETQGHHEDYSKPLDVVWLCREHHEERHLEIRRARSALTGSAQG